MRNTAAGKGRGGGEVGYRWGIGKLGGDEVIEGLIVCWNREKEEGSSLQEDLEIGLGIIRKP